MSVKRNKNVLLLAQKPITTKEHSLVGIDVNYKGKIQQKVKHTHSVHSLTLVYQKNHFSASK